MQLKVVKGSRKKIVAIGCVSLLLAVLVIERLITQGTFLGYQVRSENKSIFTTDQVQESRVCELASEALAEDIFEAPVKRIATNLADVSEPIFMSICTYQTKTSPARTATLVLREYADTIQIESQLEAFKRRAGQKRIEGLADEAYYVASSKQLMVRKGTSLITVTVSEPNQSSKVGSEEAASSFARLLIK
jgi:hypothetical protein